MAKKRKLKEEARHERSTRLITSANKLENLKKEAKRLLKSLRENDEQTRDRLKRSWPQLPSEPKLRYVQHALAMEHGFAGWRALKDHVEARALNTQSDDRASTATLNSTSHAQMSLEELANLFLEYACADPIVNNGPAAHARNERAALRIVTRNPEIARYSIHTAVVCGDLQQVESILKERPGAAIEPGGPQRRRHLPEREKLWTPLLHLCYGRLPTAAAADNSIDIAKMLLEYGANPNDYFEVGSHPCRYTALCGVAGEGEDDAPPHPKKEELARLLLEHGAEPYDVQVRYNIHFHGNLLWFLKLTYEFSVKAGREADWRDPDWSMLNMGGYGTGARWNLVAAVKRNDLELVEWCLTHGASANSGAGPHPRFSELSLREYALRNGFVEMADLLARHGATQSGPLVLEGIEAFIDSCFRLDRKEAQRHLAEHPEYLSSSAPIFAAARRDRADVVEFLLDLGTSIEVEDEHKQRPLHEAAGHDSINVAKLLVERGAELEPVETQWNNTPLDHAMYGNLRRMVEYLSGFSRDVFRLSWIGNLERLREVLREQPDLARSADDGNTPLMWLPDDEARAEEAVKLLVACGADPKIINKEGMTAADCAERRGLYDTAELLRSYERTSP